MLDSATVTLRLAEFDELRSTHRAHREIVQRLAGCFEYSYIQNPEPEECKDCKEDDGCEDCKIYHDNPPYDEKLTVDVDHLIKVAKEYSLYGKDIITDLDTVRIERAGGH